jgi:flagellar protein FlaD
MGENEVDSKVTRNEDFDLGAELSSLVVNNVLPAKIAEKLEKRLKEKKLTITKEQFHMLAQKIRNVLDSQENFQIEQTETIKEQPKQNLGENSDENMKTIADDMDKLKERIEILEGGFSGTLNIGKNNERSEIIGSEKPENLEMPLSNYEQNTDLAPLSKIPSDPQGIIVLMKWLQFLIDKCGRTNLPEILDYYVDVEWITEDTKISLIDYSNGITAGKETKESSKKDVNNLPSKDHIQSFMFIQKLKGMKFDKHFVERIDDEISRLTKVVNKNQL